jgi:hypothetical protein
MGIKITDDIELPNQFAISVSGIWNWYKKRKDKRILDKELNNAKKWREEYGNNEFTTVDNSTTVTNYTGERIDEISSGYNGPRNGG